VSPKPDDRALKRKIRRISEECVGMRARLLDRAITGVYNAELEPLGVKLSQLNVLIAVARLEPAPPAKVAWALNLEGSTLSRNADRLRASGYLDVELAEDGRSKRYVLTPAGSALIDEAYPGWKRAQARVEELLGSEGVEALLEFARERPYESPAP
jgi:DNA-binding MarR family transcriptional regulator